MATKSEITDKLLHLFFVVAGFTLVSMFVLELMGGTDNLARWVEDAGAWAPAAYLVLKMSTFIFAPLSGSSIELASGAIFGVWGGVFLSLVGSTLGGVVNYWIARLFGRKGIVKFAGQKGMEQVDHATERIANWRVLAMSRIVLSPIYDFITYAAGLTRIPFWQFLAVSFIGGIPVAFFFPLIGHASVSNNSGNMLVMAVSAAAFVGLGALIIYRKYKQSKTAS